jgi:GDPmannose 4,6-dehydratase
LLAQFFEFVIDEQGIVESITGDNATALSVGDVVIRIEPCFFRPAEVETLLGDPTNPKQNSVGCPKSQCRKCVRKRLKMI